MKNDANKAEKIQIILCVIGILAGLVLAVIACIKLIDGLYYDPGYSKFGADFYTEIYGATRHAVLKLSDMHEDLELGILIAGLGVAAGFGIRLCGVFSSIETRNTYLRLMQQGSTPQTEAPQGEAQSWPE